MSYILDALKKSEKERQRGTLPDMLTVQDIVAEKSGKHLTWPYILVAALLINAGVFVWWSGFFQKKETKVAQNLMTDVALHSPANGAAQQIPDSEKQYPESMQSISAGSRGVDKLSEPLFEKPVSPISDRNSLRTKGTEGMTSAQREISSKLPMPANDNIKPSELSPEKVKQAEGPVRLPSEPTGSLTEIPDDNKIYKLKELPLSIGQKLPRFAISALLYSDNPASRMVRINDQMMYEGQDLTEGLKLEEITKDGVIFRHQKYRIWVGLK